MASKCRKFVPNIFHKSKCQNCFAAKDIHSAQALENNKASRKATIFGYLFVSPDLDFSNPLDKAKRWQRRFFVLYDDGELTYSVDENPDTVPQGEVDMNKCIDVYDAESITGHQFSLAVAIPEKNYYIKGNGKEEISRWYEVLVVYPRSIKTKRRIVPPYRSDRETSQSDNSQNLQSGGQYNFGVSLKNNYPFERFDIDKLKSSTPTTYRGVRSLKHKNDKHYSEGLRKSNSLHDLSSNGEIPCSNLESSKYLSRSGDNLNFIPIVDSYDIAPKIFEGSDSRRASDSSKSDSPLHSSKNNQDSKASSPSKSSNGEKSSGHRSRRGSFDEKRASPIRPRTPTSRSISLIAEKSTNSREFSSRLSLPKSDSDIDIDGPPTRQQSNLSPDDNVLFYSSRNNETDELKQSHGCMQHCQMAKSSEMNAAAKQKDLKTERKIEDMMYMKKGWLIKQGSTEKDWKKHWFVLDANSLRYFKDAKAEESNALDGKIDLSTCYSIEEIEVIRNYGFSVKNQNGEYVLTAMTSGLRKNWMQAIKICVEMLNWKEPPKGIRRHHSDVNPGNVGKALMIHEISHSSSSSYFKTIDSASINSKESKENLSQKSFQSSEYVTDYASSSKSQKSGNSISSGGAGTSTSSLGSSSNWIAPIGRYVEGSDNALLSGDLHKKKLERSESRYLPHRTKSPSARVKDKTRSKLPKLLSPPPETEQPGYNIDSSYSAHTESGSSEEYDHSPGLDHNVPSFMDSSGDNQPDGPLSTGDGMLVDLLETEVETLRERLDHTEQELVQLHQDKMDLKTQLRNVCSEKENSKAIDAKNLPQTLRRQLKEAKDVIQCQKSEVDVLKSKLDMSVSKLTGTEKALSEALKELKQEKEQYTKMSNDWAKRIKTVDAQLRETSQKLEKSRDALQAKEKECKRLETEVKLNMQKLRDSEREVIKLKAVEVEYRQAKERLDNNHRELECLRKNLKEKDIRCRKLEGHIEEIKQEFRQEKANFERDLSKMKEKIDDSTDTMSQSLTSDISSILSGKNAIINQLEEKLIESHNKIEEISEDMQDEIQRGAALRPQLDAALKENMYLKDQLDLLENALMDLQKKMDTDEKEKMVLKKQVEEQQREGKALLSKLEDEHIDNSNLQEENSDLKNMMVNLNDQLQGHRTDVNQLVEKALEEKEGIYKQKLSEISTSLTSGRSLVSMVNSLLSQIMDTQKKDYSHVLASAISSAADLESCLSTAQSVIEGLPPLTKTEALEQSMSAKEQAEIASIKLQLTEAIKENKNLHREFNDAYSDLSRLEAENKNLRERVELLEDDYNHKLNELSGKIDELMSKLHSTGGESGGDGSRHHNSSSPQNFESQLEDLEKRIHHVGSVMKSQQMQSKVLNRQLLHSCGEDDASNLSEDSESESSEELSDEEFDSEFDDIGDDDNAKIISSLRHMSSQVSSTNSRLHDVTQNLSKSSTGSSSSPKKAGLQQRLHSCEQKVCHLTNRLSMENEFADITEGKTVDEIKLAFYGCLSCVQSKLIAVNEEVRAIESAGTKQQANKLTPKIKDKLCYLIRYIKHMQNLTEEDWYILGRLQVKKTSVERHLHNRLEHTKPDEPGKADEQILQYAEKLALEVVILGELAYLLQNNYLANRCVDSLWKEINEVNQLFLQVQEKVMKDLEECRVDNDSELLSNYVKMLSQKIVVEGHLISSLGIGKAVLADQAEKSEDLSDLPCLATEAISRTLACEYMEHQFHYLGDQLEKFSGHFTAQALLQGEMTYALINLKEKIDQQMVGESKEFIKEEAKTAFVKLKEQENACYEIVQKYKEQKLLKIQDIIKCSSGKQNVILVVSQVHRLLQTHIKQYEDMLEPSLPTSKKCQIIHDSLKVEQDSFLKTMQVTLQENEELECYEKEFMDNIKSHLMELADVLVLNATIRGQVTYITELYGTKFGTSPPTSIQDLDADSSISDDERRWENLMKKLGSVLTGEAKIKSQAAFQLVDQCIDIDQGRIQEIKELLLCLPSVQGYCPHRLTNYSNQVIREAVFQAQMCYLMEKLRLEYEEEINQLRILNSSPNMRGFQSQDNRECEVDVQGMMQVFETVFEQKYKDELSVFSALEKEIDSLKYAAATEGTNCNECIWAKELIDNLEMVFNEQYSKAKNKHEVNTDSFNKEMTSVSSKVTKVIEERDREKETLVSFYEDRISLMQEEFDCLTVERDEELAQVKMDIMTAVGAIQASEHQTEAQRCEQVKQLTRNIAMQKYYFNVLIDEVKQRISDPKLMQKIDRFQQNLQLPSNENLKDENDDQAEKFLSANSSFELSKDDTSTAGDGDKHEQQMAQLKKEKDDALAQEAKLTKAALESMSKAYEDNLETEKNRFRDALKTMYTEDYVNEIRRHHELEVGKLQEELKSLNLHYTSKCEDYKMLEERLSRSKTEQNEHMTTLLARNEQLTTLVEEELTELKELVKKRSPRGLPAGSSSLEEDLYEAQIMNRMKDSDIQKLRSQVTAGDVNLNRITEEHKQVMTQYLHCKKLYSALQEENIGLKSKLEKAIGETKPDQNSLQRRQQPVRRVPSFHHRARSPSPGHPSSQRKEEHISRDSHKGRRYQLKDIRRSRSSPSLPFVFGSKQLLGEKTLLVSKDSMSGMSSTCRR